MLKSILFSLSLLLCLNLSHAQTTEAPPALPSGTIPAITTPPAPSSEPLGSMKSAPGKYEEYQSICRKNEYDHIVNLKVETKMKRIQLLQSKLKSGKEISKIKLRLLKEWIDQHKLVEASETYADLKNMKLTVSENQLADAYNAYAQKKFKVAQDILVKLIATEIKNVEIAKFLAEIYKEQNNYFEAAQIYDDLNKQTSGGYFDLLCESLVLDSHHADGEKACKKATQEKPENPYPLIYLGVSSREKELRPEALDYFTRSLKLKDTEMGLTCLAEVYYMSSRFGESAETFKKSLALTPTSVRALIGLAWAQLKDKNLAEALVTFKKVCHIDKKLDVELRKAYKYLASQNSPDAKKLIDLTQTCND